MTRLRAAATILHVDITAPPGEKGAAERTVGQTSQQRLMGQAKVPVTQTWTWRRTRCLASDPFCIARQPFQMQARDNVGADDADAFGWMAIGQDVAPPRYWVVQASSSFSGMARYEMLTSSSHTR